MRTLLSGWGCEVSVAADLQGALAALRDQPPPDAILADYHLDEGDGLALIDEVRRTMNLEVPAVLLTADRTPAVREAAGAARVHILNKPVRPAALRALLTQWRASRVAAE
jgi:CheY-like chemotaxis protein